MIDYLATDHVSLTLVYTTSLRHDVTVETVLVEGHLVCRHKYTSVVDGECQLGEKVR
jgi:hypothetical protein